jgi:ribosomal subunit interface protein
MQLSVTGKQIDVGSALRLHIEKSLESAVAKYFDNAIEGAVVLAREGRLFRADISVHIGRGIMAQGHGEASEAYAAFDTAADRIAKRLRRYKRRLRNHHKNRVNAPETLLASQYILAPEEDEDEDEDEDEGEGEGEGEDGDACHPVIVAEMSTEIITMTVGEAVMRMDLAELPVMMFRNSAHGGFNLVYRRPDGNVGWIDPQGSQAAVE